MVGDAASPFDPTVATVGAARAGEDWVLTGTVERVVDADVADDLLVAASGPDGVGLFAAEGAATERIPLLTLNQTRRQATVRFSNTPARLVVGPKEGSESVIRHALTVGAVLLAAEQVGAAQHVLDLTVGYAKTCLQFGRPIGSFQAVKHKLADLLVEVEHARSVASHAAWALDEGTDDDTLAASIAQAMCSAAYARIAPDAIQLHGGIGFTWEYQVQLYYKRAVADSALLGSAEQHRDRIAALVLDGASH